MMTEFFLGQAVYVHSPADTWVRGVVRQIGPDGRPELVEMVLHPEWPTHILLARPGELVKGDGG